MEENPSFFGVPWLYYNLKLNFKVSGLLCINDNYEESGFYPFSWYWLKHNMPVLMFVCHHFHCVHFHNLIFLGTGTNHWFSFPLRVLNLDIFVSLWPLPALDKVPDIERYGLDIYPLVMAALEWKASRTQNFQWFFFKFITWFGIVGIGYFEVSSRQ